jgi:hypothetical protein
MCQSSLGDEEIHVVAAMLRNNITIEELQFRRNNIGDDGARAIAALLAEPSAIKFIDLRENNIGVFGIKAIAEALERSERVQKVFVHPGGKIEAMGSTESSNTSESAAMAVSTVCVVDIRDNRPKDAGLTAGLSEQIRSLQKERLGERNTSSSGSNVKTKADNRRSASQSPSTKQRPQNKRKSTIGSRSRPSSDGSRRK